MDLWNIKDLDPPPILTCKATTKEIDIRLLDIALKNGIDFFKNQQHLSSEAALLSRTMYRLKMKFRNSKDFKSVEKLCRVLRAYLQLQIPKLLENLSKTIPQNYKVNKTCTLTKNMMDFVLVRFQGLGKTLCRILETCKIVSSLMQQRLRLGHFWKIAVIVFASASRIFVISKNILKYICEMYLDLLPFSSSLNNAGVQWLPEDYVFPSRLDEWLNVDWLDLENNVIEIEDDDLTMSYFKLTDSDDDDVEFCDEYILVNDESVIDKDGGESLMKVDSDEDEEEDVIHEKNEVVDKQRKSVENVVDLLCEKNYVDVGEVINVSDVVNESDVIDVSDEVKRRKRKRKKSLQKKNDNLTVGNSNGDIGEVINVSDVMTESDVIDITDETPKRKKKRKKNSAVNKVQHNLPKKGINVNKVDLPKQSKRKRKRGVGNVVGKLNSAKNSQGQKRNRRSYRYWKKDV